MPVTITLPQPADVIGPGVFVNVQTDLIGPIGGGEHWKLTVYSGVEPTVNYLQSIFVADTNPQSLQLLTGELGTTIGGQQMKNGEQITVLAELLASNFLAIDSGVKTNVTWDSTAGLGLQIPTVAGRGGGGGLTTEEHEMLLAINAATQVPITLNNLPTTLPLANYFAWTPLDQLTTTSLSNGITCDPVRADVGFQPLAGIQLAVASYPPDWIFRTPDAAWGFHDLAVLSFWRGGQLVKRLGIHTTSFTEAPLPGSPFPWIVALAGGWLLPADYQIFVDWAEGVCGELRGLYLP